MIQFDYDASNRRAVIQGDEDIIQEVTEHFSYENPGAKFARKIGRFIPERSYFITPTRRFDEGLTNTIKSYIDKNYPGTEINISEQLQIILNPKFTDTSIAKLSFDLRDYQEDIVNLCLQKGRGVVLLATAGGKTLTFANLLQSIYNSETKKDTWKVLVIVPDLGLVNQTFDDFKKYDVGFTYSKWTGNNELNLGSNVIIANLGILQSKNTDTEWVKFIDMLIIDEVHKLRRDNKINKLIKSIKTTRKFGFTGTLPEETQDQWNIVGKIGDILFEKRSFELREDNYVANAEASVFNILYNKKLSYNVKDLTDPGAWYRMEQEFIQENKFRNNFIGKICNGLNNNVLVLIDLIAHGENLYSTITNICPNKQVFFIRGDVEVEDRDKVKQIMEKENNVICIAISKIFSTGISINNIHYIVFAGGGKAKVKILQSIGRGLRLHANKQKLVLIDIADQLKYASEHSDRRLELYKNERIITKSYTFKETV
jgi:superfamily II DNA or RNA helicase